MTDLVDRVARAIALEAIGFEFDDLFVCKADWVAKRGEGPRGYVDCNTPYQVDVLDAARAAIAVVLDEAAKVVETLPDVDRFGSGDREEPPLRSDYAAAIRALKPSDT